MSIHKGEAHMKRRAMSAKRERGEIKQGSHETMAKDQKTKRMERMGFKTYD